MARSRNTSKLINNGGLQLPSWSTASRPSSPTNGLMGYNTTLAAMEYYYDNAGWERMYRKDGLTSSTAFDSLAEIDASGLTGIQTLYFTFGNSISAIQCQFDLSTTGGPWLRVSFDFTNCYGATVLGSVKTFCLYGDSVDNGMYANSSRYGDTGNLGLGEGTQYMDEIFTTNRITNTYGAVQSSEQNAWGALDTDGTGFINGNNTINYWNHGTQSNFSSSEKSAMQDWVTNLCPLTPHVAQETDSQNYANTTAWNDQGGPQTTAGHEFWCQDKNNVYQRMTAYDNSTEESSSCFIYTEKTYNAVAFDGAISSRGSGTPTGLINTKMILPEIGIFSSGTGGGLAFGTPILTQNINNIANGRAYFLIKG